MEATAVVQRLLEPLKASYVDDDEGFPDLIDLAVLVASADGLVDDAERDTLAASLETLLGSRLSRVVIRHLISTSGDSIESTGIDARATQIGLSLEARSVIEQGLRVAIAVAFASDGMSGAERSIIARIAQAGAVTDPRLQELVAEVREELGE